MNPLPDIERSALNLAPEDRARLAVSLLISLEEQIESPASGVEQLWNDEAERRFREIQHEMDQRIPAEEVFAELRKRRP